MNGLIRGAELGLEWMNTPEQIEKLRAFATSFGDDHKITTLKYPIVVLKNKITGQWKSYWQMHLQTPVAFTAWHPDQSICTPQDVIEGIKILKGWAQFQHGGGMTAVPIDTKTFTDEKMERFGMKNMNAKLFEIL